MTVHRLRPFPTQLDELTGIRFFLAIGVVLFHYQLMWDQPPETAGLITKARLGVDVFFILSGFILTHVYLAGDKPVNYRAFMVARFARIYPAHLVILIGMLGIFVAAQLSGNQLNGDHFNALGFFRTLFLVQAWFPSDTLTNWNGPSWSLSAEWFVYLVFPAYAWIALALRARPWVLLGFSILAFAGLDWGYQATTGTILPNAEDNLGILRIIPEFLYGIGLYYLGQGFAPSRPKAIVSAIVTTLALITAMHWQLDERIIVTLAGPFLLSMALLSKAGGSAFLSNKVAVFWGEASFALYLIHMPIMMIWRNVVQRLFGLPHEYKMGIPELGLMLVVTLAGAAALHVLVEHPGRRLIRALLNKPKP